MFFSNKLVLVVDDERKWEINWKFWQFHKKPSSKWNLYVLLKFRGCCILCVTLYSVNSSIYKTLLMWVHNQRYHTENAYIENVINENVNKSINWHIRTMYASSHSGIQFISVWIDEKATEMALNRTPQFDVSSHFCIFAIRFLFIIAICAIEIEFNGFSMVRSSVICNGSICTIFGFASANNRRFNICYRTPFVYLLTRCVSFMIANVIIDLQTRCGFC